MLIVTQDLETAYLFTEKNRGYCLYSGTEMAYLCRWGILPCNYDDVINEPKLKIADDSDRHEVSKRLLEIKEFYEKVLPAYKDIFDAHLSHGIKLPELVEAMNNFTIDKVGQVNHIYNLVIQKFNVEDVLDDDE